MIVFGISDTAEQTQNPLLTPPPPPPVGLTLTSSVNEVKRLLMRRVKPCRTFIIC